MAYNSKELKVKSTAKKLAKPKDAIVSKDGQYKYAGQITKILGNQSGTPITMKGVSNYLKGVDNLGNTQMMYPGAEYFFPGSSVTEYPIKRQLGGPTPPEDWGAFLAYNITAPENRQAREGWTYGDPNDYDHYGMWEALGKPSNFDEAIKNNPDWTPNEDDDSYHGFSVNPNTGVWLKNYQAGEGVAPGSTGWMEANQHYLNPESYNNFDLVYDPELQRMRYVPKQKRGGSIPIAQNGIQSDSGTYVKVRTSEGVKTLNTDSEEYRKYYGQGTDNMLAVNYDGTFQGKDLEEATVTGVDPMSEKYPYWNNLSEEQKRYINDPSVLGNNVRSQATSGYGINGNPTFSQSINTLVKQGVPAAANDVYEGTGLGSLVRVVGSPIKTGKGLLQTGADIIASPYAAYDYYLGSGQGFSGENPITGESYGEGLDETLDVVASIPGIGLATKVGKPLATNIARTLKGSLATSLPGLSNIPGATFGNAIGSGFAGSGLYNIVPNTVEMYNNPSWDNAAKIGLDVLNMGPVIGPVAKAIAATKASDIVNYTKDAANLVKYSPTITKDIVKESIKAGRLKVPERVTVGRLEPKAFDEIVAQKKHLEDKYLTNAQKADAPAGSWLQVIKDKMSAEDLKNYLLLEEKEKGIKQFLHGKVLKSDIEKTQGINLPGSVKEGMSFGPGEYGTYQKAFEAGALDDIENFTGGRITAEKANFILNKYQNNPLSVADDPILIKEYNDVTKFLASKPNLYNPNEAINLAIAKQLRSSGNKIEGSNKDIMAKINEVVKEYQRQKLGIPAEYLPFEEGGFMKKGGSKKLKINTKFTNKNIQSSINELFKRNETLFGPKGKKYYKPFAEGGSTNNTNMKKLTDKEIAFPQQPTAAEFYARGFVPNSPVGFYRQGGMSPAEAYPQQPPADIFFSGYPFQPQYMRGGMTNGIAFPQQPTAEYFFSGHPWFPKYQPGGVVYGSPEYNQAYEEGTIASKGYDGVFNMNLPDAEAMAEKYAVTAVDPRSIDPMTGERFAMWNQLPDQYKQVISGSDPMAINARNVARQGHTSANDYLADVRDQLVTAAAEGVTTGAIGGLLGTGMKGLKGFLKAKPTKIPYGYTAEQWAQQLSNMEARSSMGGWKNGGPTSSAPQDMNSIDAQIANKKNNLLKFFNTSATKVFAREEAEKAKQEMMPKIKNYFNQGGYFDQAKPVYERNPYTQKKMNYYQTMADDSMAGLKSGIPQLGLQFAEAAGNLFNKPQEIATDQYTGTGPNVSTETPYEGTEVEVNPSAGNFDWNSPGGFGINKYGGYNKYAPGGEWTWADEWEQKDKQSKLRSALEEKLGVALNKDMSYDDLIAMGTKEGIIKTTGYMVPYEGTQNGNLYPVSRRGIGSDGYGGYRIKIKGNTSNPIFPNINQGTGTGTGNSNMNNLTPEQEAELRKKYEDMGYTYKHVKREGLLRPLLGIPGPRVEKLIIKKNRGIGDNLFSKLRNQKNKNTNSPDVSSESVDVGPPYRVNPNAQNTYNDFANIGSEPVDRNAYFQDRINQDLERMESNPYFPEARPESMIPYAEQLLEEKYGELSPVRNTVSPVQNVVSPTTQGQVAPLDFYVNPSLEQTAEENPVMPNQKYGGGFNSQGLRRFFPGGINRADKMVVTQRGPGIFNPYATEAIMQGLTGVLNNAQQRKASQAMLAGLQGADATFVKDQPYDLGKNTINEHRFDPYREGAKTTGVQSNMDANINPGITQGKYGGQGGDDIFYLSDEDIEQFKAMGGELIIFDEL